MDDVTHLSLEVGKLRWLQHQREQSTVSSGDWVQTVLLVRTRTPSRSLATIQTNMRRHTFDYDSKKSGGVTMSHLRFGKKPIKSTYLIHKANFVACHNPSYVNKYNMVQELVDGGTFLLNCSWDMEGLEKHLPGQVKAFIADHNIKFYTIDGIKIGKEIGLGGRINTVLQSAFFKLASIIPEEEAIDLMKKAAKSYLRKKR